VIERWSRDQVLALAPDAASRKAAQGVGTPAKWSGAGAAGELVFGECAGSGAKRYHSCVDLAETAFRCDCPSRKFPCKHALGLLLLWSEGAVAETERAPAWADEWLARRRERAARTAANEPAAEPAGQPDRPRAAASATAAQRAERVTAGLSDLERWLEDQIRQGIAEARRTGPQAWADLHRRLIDVQAPGLAAVVSRLPAVLRDDDWPGRLLGEYALMHLLAVGHRGGTDDGPLRDTIRSRIGFPVTREQVLAGERVRDRWDVIGSRDEEQDRLTARRVWLRGRTTGRAALVLSFAPPGQALDASLVTGTTIDADLAFYPGASPLRALVATRYGVARQGPPPGATLEECLAEVAGALAGDPWADSWPVVINGVVPGKDPDPLLAVAHTPESAPSAGRASAGGGSVTGGDPAPERTPGSVPASEGSRTPGMRAYGVPLHPEVGIPWRLIAVSGGRPVTVGAEWTPRGFRPLTVWDEETARVVIL
jgi:hypothetical protein